MSDRSVYSVAREAGVQQSALYRWLSGEQASISSEILERLFATLGISLTPQRRPARKK